MRIVILLVTIILLSFVYANASKAKRQVSFDFGFPSNQQSSNIGQIIGGLFGQGGNKTENPNTLGGLFDTLSGVATQIGANQNLHTNQGCSHNNGGCQHGCRLVHGRTHCFCNDGFHLHVHDGSCWDNNECTEFRPCQERCENTFGSFRCICSRGTVQPDGSCRSGGFPIGGGGGHHSRQSCNNNNGGCEQICIQHRNGVECRCKPGYSPSPQNTNSCQDLDECATGSHTCHNHCVNTIGSYSCQGVSFPNSQVSTCANNNGGCDHICRDTENGVRCRCQRNFILQAGGKSCKCPDGTRQEGNQCVGSFPPNNRERINCNVENGGCEQKCVRPKSGKDKCRCNRRHFKLQSDRRSCACEDGYTLSFTGFKCLDEAAAALQIESCDIDNGGCQFRCTFVNMFVGNICRCPKNSQLQADGRSCVCNAGLDFSPNGKRCIEKINAPQRIDPCTVNNGGCHGNCKANENQVLCSCNAPLVLAPDGKSCLAEDPCKINNGGCDHICNKDLTNKASCSCQSGWQLDSNGRNCREIPPSNVPTSTTTKPRTGCGVNNKKDLLRRIVGGKPADPKDWPWMAAILRKRNEDQFCGGVLITDRHVLTASHCLVDFKKEDLLVRLGEYDFSTATENNPTDFVVVDIRLHEMYNRSSQENDIALMKLDRPSSFSEFVWPVCLPPPNQDFMNQLGYVTGWGTTSFGGEISRVLQEVVVPVWDQNDCSSAYPKKVLSTMMCAGLKEGGKDSCQGDSGGPFLVQIYPSSRWFVIGVVSWGIKCAEAGNPGVYTRVNEYLPWIRENAIF